MPTKRVINIALLGLGKLGTGFSKIIKEKQEKIKEETGFELRLKKILIKNLDDIVVNSSCFSIKCSWLFIF